MSKTNNSPCCISNEDQQSLAKGVDQLYQASTNAPLTAPQHQGLVEVAQGLMGIIQKIGAKATTVEVVEPSASN